VILLLKNAYLYWTLYSIVTDGANINIMISWINGLINKLTARPINNRSNKTKIGIIYVTSIEKDKINLKGVAGESPSII